MKNILLIAALIGIHVLTPGQSAIAQDDTAAEEPVVDLSKMKVYYMGFLKRGPERSQDSTEAMKIQKQHLLHMQRLHKEGKLVMAGPFMDDGDIRGIVVYDVESLEEAVRLTEQDPAVKAGRLTVEVHPWWAERGSTLP
ncbi:MAG: hypothetical protein CL946_11010 [Ectothiorhodospiraceae bacterium]|nr:hypothetical protein [Ectothiorhodospiraceae bacterium]